MLKTLPPLLTPDALHALASMGHGDDVAVVDANFPASKIAAKSGARLVMLPGCNVSEALAAVLQLLPLDDFEPERAWTMQVVGDAAAVPIPVAEIRSQITALGEPEPATLERHAFYAQCLKAYAIFQTTDQRKYANVVLRKGVISVD